MVALTFQSHSHAVTLGSLHFLPSGQDWFRFYKWDGESTYPCIGSGSCLTSDDRYLDGNNPCDGQPMVGTWKGKGACTASCRWASLAGLNRTFILRWASWSLTNAVKMVHGSTKKCTGNQQVDNGVSLCVFLYQLRAFASQWCVVHSDNPLSSGQLNPR